VLCTSCSKENEAGRKFCGQCGAQLFVLCGHCEAPNSPEDRFCGDCGERLANAASSSTSESPRAASTVHLTTHTEKPAERRHLTVLFCDLIGSTELSSRLDPEELTDIYASYRKLCEQVVARYDGYVAEYLGDGIVVYFGYPNALERSAERAVRAALAVIDAVNSGGAAEGEEDPRTEAISGTQISGQALSAHIGIATGLVVAGDLQDASSTAQVRAVIGEAPTIAARLQSHAPADCVVISRETKHLIGDSFEYELWNQGGSSDEPMGFLVRRPSAQNGLTTGSEQAHNLFVGRERELALFADRWASVKEGQGETILISGDPGIGKSRVLLEMQARLADEPHLTLELSASPFYANTAFYPVAQLLRRQFDLPDTGMNESAIARLAEGLADMGWPEAGSLPLLAELLSFPYSGGDANADLSAEGRRLKTLELLSEWVLKLADRQPLLLLAEDLHWTDPSTLDLLERLIRMGANHALLVVATFRPEFENLAESFPNLTTLPLQPLRKPEVESLVKDLAHGLALPSSMIDQVALKTDGVPLFVEELTRTLLESDLLRQEGDRWERTDPLPEMSIPSTLQDSLMVRLDRLGTAKELAQRAAIIGREFGYPLLTAISGRSEQELAEDLHTLVSSRLVYTHGSPPHASYIFKHALIRDAAYESMLKRHREPLHEAVATALSTQFPELAAREPEVLAAHYAEAGKTDEAVKHYLLAGKVARSRSADHEAVNHLRKGIELVSEVPTAERDQLELSLLITMVPTLISTIGYADPAVEKACARARALCEAVGSSPDVPLAIYWLANFYMNSSQLPACREMGQQLLALSEEEGNELHRPAALLMLGFVNYFDGRLEECMHYIQLNMECYDLERDRGLFEIYGQDPGASAYGVATVAAWQLGKVDTAVEYGRRGVELAQAIGDPFTQAMTEAFNAYTRIHRRERTEALRLTRASIPLCEEQAFPQWLNQAHVACGWCLADGSETTGEGLSQLQLGLEELAKTSMVIGAPFFMTLLVEALINAGQHEAAAETTDQILALSNALGNKWMDSNLLRIKAELMLTHQPDNRTAAREIIDRALHCARDTGSRVYEVRTLCLAWHHNLATPEDTERLAQLNNELEAGEGTLDRAELNAVIEQIGS
jgi:class 3 adenylate cyclase/tetratricopeptide (TPR) repeat protein